MPRPRNLSLSLLSVCECEKRSPWRINISPHTFCCKRVWIISTSKFEKDTIHYSLPLRTNIKLRKTKTYICIKILKLLNETQTKLKQNSNAPLFSSWKACTWNTNTPSVKVRSWIVCGLVFEWKVTGNRSAYLSGNRSRSASNRRDSHT